MGRMTRDADKEHRELAGHAGVRGDEMPPVAPDDAYVVERVLKESSVELTQLVRLRGARTLFVRKCIRSAGGLGSVYRDVYAAQRAGLDCPHLPCITMCRDEGTWLVVVMTYAQGVTLRELVEDTPSERRLNLARVVFPELCAAASDLHEGLARPIIHRDLTPSNVIVDPADPHRLTLIDLGIARSFKNGVATDTSHFGTKPYAPPEQYGFGQTNVRTDVFALGLTLFFCLTGRDPVPADRTAGFLVPGVPAAVSAVVARASSFDPADRYASARDLATAFVRALAGKDGPAVGEGAQPSQAGEDAHRVGGDAAARGVAGSAMKRPLDLPPTPREPSLASRILGIAWNLLVLAAFVLFTSANVSSVRSLVAKGKLDPTDALMAVFFEAACVVIGFLLADKRGLRKRIPLMRRSNVWLETAVGLLALVILVLLLLMVFIALWAVGLT